ncbi:MAG TPA: hypothetical protein VK453_15100 [Micromonosporaceae bacterium]|nr:hypothetical protein [Micromonosporaceae bacterium]
MEQRTQLALEVEPGWTRPGVLMPVLALVALVAGTRSSFTTSANLLVLCVGGSLFWLGMSRSVVRRPAPRRLPTHAAWWLVPTVLLVAVELTNFGVGSTYAHPTLSKLIDPSLTRYGPRAALFFAWSAAFLALVRR